MASTISSIPEPITLRCLMRNRFFTSSARQGSRVLKSKASWRAAFQTSQGLNWKLERTRACTWKARDRKFRGALSEAERKFRAQDQPCSYHGTYADKQF